MITHETGKLENQKNINNNSPECKVQYIYSHQSSNHTTIHFFYTHHHIELFILKIYIKTYYIYGQTYWNLINCNFCFVASSSLNLLIFFFCWNRHMNRIKEMSKQSKMPKWMEYFIVNACDSQKKNAKQKRHM